MVYTPLASAEQKEVAENCGSHISEIVPTLRHISFFKRLILWLCWVFCLALQSHIHTILWKAHPSPVQLENFHSSSRFTEDVSSTVKRTLGDNPSWFSCISAHLAREEPAALCSGLSLQQCLCSK